MIYLYPNGSSFSVIYDRTSISVNERSQLIEIESLPEGNGILRRANDGSFYYEPAPEPKPIEPEIVESKPTLEDVAEETLLETKYQTLLLEMML